MGAESSATFVAQVVCNKLVEGERLYGCEQMPNSQLCHAVTCVCVYRLHMCRLCAAILMNVWRSKLWVSCLSGTKFAALNLDSQH